MKVGRNDPCPCGSGKKYKKCCAAKAQAKRSFAAKPLTVDTGLLGKMSGAMKTLKERKIQAVPNPVLPKAKVQSGADKGPEDLAVESAEVEPEKAESVESSEPESTKE